MFLAIRKRLERKEEGGFTLIELMVVVLIIAILIAIAIPTFLGARTRAQNRAAQSDLRNALTAAKTYYTDAQSYDETAMTAAVLDGIEPSLTFVDDETTASQTNIGLVGAAASVLFVKQSASGTWFCIKDVATGAGAGTFYDSGAALADVDTAAECVGTAW